MCRTLTGAISALTLVGVVAVSVGPSQSQAPLALPRFPAPVIINVDQAAFLTKEAGNLQVRITDADKNLKTLESEQQIQKAAGLLWGRAESEALNVGFTRASFLKLAGNNTQQRQAADVFFGQFETQYRQLSPPNPKVANATFFPGFRTRAINTFTDNARAYRAVAAARSLTFDLEVSSAPTGAVLSYRRPGDPYEKHPDPTNTTLRNLIYAVWTVRGEIPGRERQEKEHNPWREPNHVLVFVF